MYLISYLFFVKFVFFFMSSEHLVNQQLPVTNCNFYDIDSFNNLNLKKDELFIVNYNVRSFNSNYDEFSIYVSELKQLPNFIVLSETWFMGDNADTMPGYSGTHCNRNVDCAGPGGGISIFVKDTMNAAVHIEMFESLPEIEYIHAKIVYEKTKTINILAIYRPPVPTLLNDFSAKIENILENIPNGRKLVVAGDLNINGLNPGRNDFTFIDVATSYGLTSHITLPTRPNQVVNSSSQIDHIWTNFEAGSIAGAFSDLHATDHLPNFVLIPIKIPYASVKKTFRDHSDNCIQLMANRLINFDLFFPLLTATLGFNEKFDVFYIEIMRIYKVSCPIKTKTISTKNLEKPWLTDSIRNVIKRKHYLFKRYKDGAIDFLVYNEFKKSTDKIVKNSKRNFLAQKYEECNSNSEKCWRLTNNFVLNNNKTGPISFEIIHDNCTLTDEKQISDIFNSYFVGVGLNLAENITPNNINPLSYLGSRNENSFVFNPTTSDEIFKIVNSFKNKRTCLNNLRVFILKKVSHILSPMIADLFNDSISSGVFPEKLKLGRVIPLHKTGPKNQINNFRPITTLSVFSKVFEKLVHKRLCSFIKKHNILNDNQFGFQKNKNTSDAILEFLDNSYDSLNDNNFLMTIFLDFSKAFDTISLNILLKKLQHYGSR